MIGFIVNPIAGMGGRVALKGTDGVLEEAIKRGAKPVTPDLARLFLKELRHYDMNVEFLTGPGPLGEDYLKEFEFKHEVIAHRDVGFREIHGVKVPDTTSEDTKRLAKEMIDKVDLIVFAGGDGTARDIAEVVDLKVPILGIPSGVKMFSGVFATSPEDAARVLVEFLRGKARIERRPVMDLDEDAYRRDEIRARKFYEVLTPVVETLVQGSKEAVRADEEEDLNALAEAVAEEILENDGIYFLGAGSTIKKIKDKLGIDGTLLGVDVIRVRNGEAELLVKDATEGDLLSFIKEKPKVVVTVIGGLNFLFGRGNQQFSPKVLRAIDKDDLIVVATPSKISSGIIRVYTGDKEVDEKFRGYLKVKISPWMEKLVKVI
ncbi:ATP-NAD kinase [Thermococcus chitonophagus]|uniref:ATP-NAD kinase n=1 Tax=Thermococcus chitonophagus TaxID=54262 RepID=A0A160VUF7_9EURY|nr:ATP-NAD kinase family protein [Thermococcus chitonophagus]ASJ16326.1 ATP-NAD kinase [Thermococcus chitonophagus]CUX78682.1 ATP-NAD kinase [Thermococcus chitonophagus]